jgi:hypothetical protein
VLSVYSSVQSRKKNKVCHCRSALVVAHDEEEEREERGEKDRGKILDRATQKESASRSVHNAAFGNGHHERSSSVENTTVSTFLKRQTNYFNRYR